MIQKFTEILAWQKAHELVLRIYDLTRNFPSEEKYGLTSQIRRAAISIAANIAEGFKRNGNKDSLHFYNISEASLEETKYHLILSQDLKYISKDDFQIIMEKCDETGKVLYGWIKSQN